MGQLCALVRLLDTDALRREPVEEPSSGDRPALSTQVWQGRDDPSLSLVLTETDDPAPLQAALDGAADPPARARPHSQRWEAYGGVQIVPGRARAPEGAAGFYLVTMLVDAEAEDEFNRWYDEEHLPQLAAVPGVIAARRYRAWTQPLRYFAAYHVEDPRIPGSPPWLEAAETPWTHAMRTRMSDRQRRVFVPRRG